MNFEKESFFGGCLSRGVVGGIFLLAFVGGATALAHQVLWTRRMIDLLGASAGSAARVFGCFFLGLALGSLAGAVLAGRVRRPWRWLGAAELGIACLSVPMLLLPWWADGLWPWLGPDRLTGAAGSGLKTVLSVLLVLPPAAVMGLFLPLAVRDWPTRRPRRADPGLWLYAVNTSGAVLGIFAVSAWLLPSLSMLRVMTLVLVCNVLAAIGCLMVDFLFGPSDRPPAQDVSLKATMPARRFMIMAALSGLFVMAAEVIALLMTQLLAPLSFFAPSAVLGSFIAVLALAAFIVAGRSRSTAFGEGGMIPVLIGAGVLMALSPLFFHALAPVFPLASGSPSLSFFLLRLCLFSLLVFGPAVLVAGLWFPMIAAGSEQRLTPYSPLRWGWLLAANGLGGLAGAEGAYAILLPVFGPYGGLAVIGFAYLMVAWICLPRIAPRARVWALRGAMAITLGVLLYASPRLHTVHPSLAPGIIAEQHGREGSLVILDDPDMGRALLLQNQYVLGASAARAEAERQAHIPLLLHPAPARVAFIGLATGITAGGALAHPAVEHIEAVEISAAVTRAARDWFGDYNRGVMDDPRARIVVEDGRTWLAAYEAAFDVIVSDLFLPWGPGEGRLYTVEHFTAARRALRADGLFCLWLPMYQLDNDQFMVILNTFLQVFPETEIFMREPCATAPALGLVGWRSGKLDWTQVARRVRAAELGDPHVDEMDRLRVLAVGTVRIGSVSGPVNTLDNLWLELNAGRMRVLQGEASPYLQGARWNPWIGAFRDALLQ